jgi:hypothetical protein
MAKPNPVKGKPPRKETLEVKGNFQEFADLMRRVIRKRDEPKAVPASPSRVPGAS